MFTVSCRTHFKTCLYHFPLNFMSFMQEHISSVKKGAGSFSRGEQMCVTLYSHL